MISKKFLKFFPPSPFLLLPYAGISISDSSIRGIMFGVKGAGSYIKQYIEKPLPPGVVVAGHIQNVDEVKNVLKTIQQETGFTHVKAALPEEKGYLFKTKIPIVDPKDVRNSIEFILEENVPLPVSQVAFDYQVVGKRIHQDHLDVVVSVIPTQVVDMYVDLFNSTGFILASLEIESQSIARAVIDRENKKACLITNFYSDKIGMYVVYKGIVHFTSTISMTADMYTHPEYVSREIQKVITFWQSNKSPVASIYPIAEVYVCGEHIDESIISLCSSKLTIPLYKANIWINAFDIHTTIPQISFIESLAYATVVGLALPPHSLVYV